MTSPRITSRAGWSSAAGSSSKASSTPTSRSKDNIIRGPWADGPWPLIETPSRSQHITHPALHIANELAHTHNAMLRGLNAIYLQAPHVHQPTDVSDLLFLTQSWSAWVLDHHNVKETSMLPGFEAVLGLPAGSLTSTSSTPPGATNGNTNGNGHDNEAAEIQSLLQNVHGYAASTQAQPHTYSPATLTDLLAALGTPLATLLAAQIPLLVSMRDLSHSATSPGIPALAISSSPLSPFPTPQHPTPSPGRGGGEDRANKLLQVFLGCETAASDAMDRFVVPPMVVRLRDATAGGGGGIGGGGGGGDEWPRLSVLAVHAVADKLSPRHAGAWRFLPCDVWGRPRELAFLGREEKGKGKDGDGDGDGDRGGVR
ncbi:hypothetical protein F5B20DRAFT_137495 [Whalleya microplaca]|nr:hypothetical protein F5B20DRAFT_137495 [Whalleya microplaca]